MPVNRTPLPIAHEVTKDRKQWEGWSAELNRQLDELSFTVGAVVGSPALGINDPAILASDQRLGPWGFRDPAAVVCTVVGTFYPITTFRLHSSDQLPFVPKAGSAILSCLVLAGTTFEVVAKNITDTLDLWTWGPIDSANTNYETTVIANWPEVQNKALQFHVRATAGAAGATFNFGEYHVLVRRS